MKRNALITIAALFAVALLSAEAFAYLGMGTGYGRGMRAMDNAPEEVRLTDEQRDQIETIHQNYATRSATLHAELRDWNTAIDNETAMDKPNYAKLKDLRSQRSDTLMKINELSDQKRGEIAKVLTEKQLAYFGEDAFLFHGKMGAMGCHGCAAGMTGGQGDMNRGGCKGQKGR